LGAVFFRDCVDGRIVDLRHVKMDVIGSFADTQRRESSASDRHNGLWKTPGRLELLAKQIFDDLESSLQI
jgi:hypothetical protein